MGINQVLPSLSRQEVNRFEYITELRLAEQEAWTRAQRDAARNYFTRLSMTKSGPEHGRERRLSPQQPA